MRPLLTLSMVFVVLSLSACSTGGLKSAFRNDAPPAAPAPAVAAVDPNAPHEPTPMDTFRALAPPSGMKYTQLFAQPVDDNESRFRRLETSVQDLRNDFDTIVPSMVRLVAVEKDMKDLVGQLQTLNGTAAAAPVPTMAPAVPLADGVPPVALAPQQAEAAPAAAAPPPQEPVPQAAGVPAAGAVRAVRIGDHGDKTRVVFDVTAKPQKNAVIAGDDKQLVVDLNGLGWTIQNSWTAKSGDLVAGYHYDSGKAVFDLMSKSKIKAQDVIPGEGGRGYRLVIDLVRVNPL